MTVSFDPPCIYPKPLDCGVRARMWKACMRMCVFYTRVFLQSAFFPPAPLPTDSFFTLGFFTQYSFFLPPLHAIYTRKFFLQSAFFPPAPPPTGSFFTLGFFTQCTFFSPTPTCGFLHGSFFTECVFSSGPPANW